MANAIDGIGTINVSTLVSQLMSVEGTTQSLLQKQQTKQQSALSSLQTLNTNLAAVQTAAEKLITSVLSPRAWAVNTVTSSSTAVTGTATASATAGSYSLDVLSVATAHKVLFGTPTSSTATIGGGSLTFTRGGTDTTVDLSSAGTLADVASRINATSGLGVRASLLQVGTDSYRLQLSSTSAGAAGRFTVSGDTAALGEPAVIATGTDTAVRFGPGVDDVATSSTTTVSNLFPGLSFTVTKPETGVVLTVGQDTATMSSQVGSLVSAVNTALTTIRTATAYNATTKTGGALLGETLPSALADSLTSSLFATSGKSLAALGVSVDRSGALTFDSTRLTAALSSDPAGTTAAMQAFATRLGTVSHNATKFAGGSLTTAVTSRQKTISSLGKQISQWDTRLAAKKTQLTKQYSAVNTQLSQMSDQASWLSGQFSTLSAGSATS
jgi:flagellar hook-associated protein 2